MATKKEAAAFDDFKFDVGDFVQPRVVPIAVAATVQKLNETLKQQGEVKNFQPVFAMVLYRQLIQDEDGISRSYYIRGTNVEGDYREMELESVLSTQDTGSGL